MYNVYDKPWRAGGGAAEKIYRPSKTMDKDIYGDDVEKLIKTSRCVCVCVCLCVSVCLCMCVRVCTCTCMRAFEHIVHQKFFIPKAPPSFPLPSSCASSPTSFSSLPSFLSTRFQPDKGFSGTDASQVRDGPVQFEKDVEEDPFGLNKFLTEAKKAKRPAEDSR